MTSHPNRCKYVINCDPHYYAGDIHGNDKPYNVTDIDGSTVILGSRADADAICRMLNDHGDGPYLCAHNQYAAPEFKVVRYRGKLPAMTLASAMIGLQLQYDFRPDGTRQAMRLAQRDD